MNGTRLSPAAGAPELRAAVFRYAPEREFHTDELCHITELANTPDDEALSVALARVAPGITTRWHRLRDTAERYVMIAGRGVVEVDGLAPCAVGPHDVVVIPPGCRQRIRNVGDGELLFYALCTPRFRAEAYEAAE